MTTNIENITIEKIYQRVEVMKHHNSLANRYMLWGGLVIIFLFVILLIPPLAAAKIIPFELSDSWILGLRIIGFIFLVCLGLLWSKERERTEMIRSENQELSLEVQELMNRRK